MANQVHLMHARVVLLLALVVLLLAPGAASARIVIDKSSFTLALYAGAKQIRKYPVAVGMSGFDTPEGHFRIVSKVKDPSWLAPDAPWVPPALRGKVLRGRQSPLQGYWLGLNAPSTPRFAVGIHGTSAPESMRTRASHGCVRMLPRHAIALAKLVDVGERVLIQP